MTAVAAALLLLAGAAAPDPAPADYAADARAMGPLIEERYAYLADLPDGHLPRSRVLDAERDAVTDRRSLTRYAEDVLATLADHHAITGGSLKDSWALVPSYADLWIEERDGGFVVDAVRADSPAARAGVTAGDRLETVDGVPIARAVAKFWSTLGLEAGPTRRAYAARVLAAGRRDRPRTLGFAQAGRLTLPSLYADDRPARLPVTVVTQGRRTTIRFNDSLGDDATVAAFDRALDAVPAGHALVLDLSDTPSGGNTGVARGIMGRFARRASGYQQHDLPEEARATGIVRQWVEQVVPRGARRSPPDVRVGRWTGSMGEGLAIGLVALGARACGGRMAGLKGAIYDLDLPRTGFRFKLPVEHLSTVGGQPRETLAFPACR